MREIAMQRLFKLTPGSFFERFIIVGTRIVYDAVDMSITLVGIIDNACYVVGVIQINLVGSVICREIFDFGSVFVVEGVRSRMTGTAPSRASANTIALPIPPMPPVTTKTFLSR